MTGWQPPELVKTGLPEYIGREVRSHDSSGFHIDIYRNNWFTDFLWQLVSAKDNKETRVELLKLGADDSICKPIICEFLGVRYQYLLHHKRYYGIMFNIYVFV